MSIVIQLTEDNEIVRVFRDRGYGYSREEIHHWEVEYVEEEE
tara:strand:- start:500 stop:625 length:126 start_codon:yes stop_codon:yes gene_type:complete